MILCLVTDRRRLGTAIGAAPEEWVEALRTQVKAAGAAGVDLVQVREMDLSSRELAALVKTLIADVRHTPTKVLVNDRLDVAMASGAAGVHLKERSFSPSAVRQLYADGLTIGCSVHGADAVRSRMAANFFIAGTMLSTAVKPVTSCLGWDGLSTVVQAAGGRPVLGIGGLDVPSMPLLVVSGASGLAAIGAFVPDKGEDLEDFVQKRVTKMRLAFDSVPRVS